MCGLNVLAGYKEISINEKAVVLQVKLKIGSFVVSFASLVPEES